jgi:hypothetical protein
LISLARKERENKANEKDKHHANPIFILCLAPAETLLFSLLLCFILAKEIYSP